MRVVKGCLKFLLQRRFSRVSVHRMGCDFKARLVRFWDEGLGLSFPQA